MLNELKTAFSLIEARSLAKIKAKTEGRNTVFIWQYANKNEILEYLEGATYEQAFPRDNEEFRFQRKIKNVPASEQCQIINPATQKKHFVCSNLHDYEMATQFLNTLSGSDDGAMTFQCFDDTVKKDRKLAMWQHFTPTTDVFNKFVEYQAKGAGIYIMVNKGNGNGRRAENVVAIRALFIDLDGSPWEPPAEMLLPHIRVESSPGRYHLYWLVYDCPLDQFKSIQQAIAKRFDGDPKCVDLARVLRVPGFLHQKNEPVLTRLIEVNNIPKYTTLQVVDGLQLILTESVSTPVTKKATVLPATATQYEFTDSSSGEVFDLAIWAAQNPNFDIVSAIVPKYRRGNVRDGKQHIVCPFECQHTEQNPDLATFVANTSPVYPSFTIHCCHAHCNDRDRLEYLQTMLARGWFAIEQSQLGTVQIRRPPRVYFAVTDCLADPAWTALKPDERRVALDLTIKAWAEDGTIADDDWRIARYLAMTENEWLSYRNILNRTGLLIVSDGRITFRMAKEQFDLAQGAYMKAIEKAGNGGRKAQVTLAAKRLLQAPASSTQSSRC